ncbi:MAG: NADPH-dependent F420 reductase [Bdellovibrionales bacterium]|nr:NADPH-dependent F420 reductase [Bdellovibrionales bacterium]
MKLGFIGIGNVGGTLAERLGAKGHSIFLGARDPLSADAKELAAKIGSHASVHSVQEAVDLSDVVFLATPWNGTREIVQGLRGLDHKILIDCTNPLLPNLAGLEVGLNDSGGERVQAWAPKARVVKAFNTVGFNIMANPELEGKKVVMYFCGDDADARFQAKRLIEDVGFEPVEAGPLSSARLLEPFALLWISTAYKFGFGRDFAFSMVRGGSLGPS